MSESVGFQGTIGYYWYMDGFLRNRHHDSDPVWHVQLLVLCAVVLQFLLPVRFVAGPRFILPLISLLLLVALSATTPRKDVFQSIGRRINAITLVGLIGITNVYALVRVTNELLTAGRAANGHELILASINIYLTNIIVFALLYWEMDGGGPGARRIAKSHERDFLFPQTAQKDPLLALWNPTFIDYVYVSSTNATAFSPTDTMPLSRRAKMLMLAQSLVSLITMALVAARAVNILR